MVYQELPAPIPDGTYVRIRNSGFNRVRVAEYRGPLGPKGARVYRILVGTKPRMYSEVLEQQLEVLEELKLLETEK